MVSSNPVRPTRWRHASLGLVAILVSISLVACSTPAEMTPTIVTTPTATNSSPSSTATIAATPTQPSAPEPTPIAEESEETAEPQPLSPELLASEITALVDQVDGLVEVVIALPDGTTIAEINSYEPMEAASLYKLAILVEVYVEREMGELSLDEEIFLDPNYFAEDDSVFSEADIGGYVTIETLLDTMITLSSNVAATALLARVGNENVNLTMASLGLDSTEIRWTPGSNTVFPDDDEPSIEETETTEEPEEDIPVEEEPTEDSGAQITDRGLLRLPVHPVLYDTRADEALNVTTAADIAALYVMLINGSIVSESASQEMLALLEQQQINDRLPAYLPADTTVAHKTGNLDGLVHDAGVIFAPAGPVVVVVMTEDVVEWQAIDLIATIAQLAYESGLQSTD